MGDEPNNLYAMYYLIFFGHFYFPVVVGHIVFSQLTPWPYFPNNCNATCDLCSLLSLLCTFPYPNKCQCLCLHISSDFCNYVAALTRAIFFLYKYISLFFVNIDPFFMEEHFANLQVQYIEVIKF